MFLAPGGESEDEFRLYDLWQVKKAGQATTQISPDQDVCQGITKLRCPGKTRYLRKWNPGAWELCFCPLSFLFIYFLEGLPNHMEQADAVNPKWVAPKGE